MNKNTILIFLISVVTILFNNCADKPTQIVELKPTKNEELEIAYPNRIIMLENKKESKLKTIYKVESDFVNNRVFVLSDFNIFIFDANGDFITKLKKGRGPNEISRIVSFTLNTKNKRIYATQDFANRLTVIDYDGNILKTHELFNFYFQAVEVIDSSNVLLLNNTASKTNPFFIGKFNLTSEIITETFIPADNSNYPLLSYSMINNFTTYKDRLFFSYSSIFGLYEYKNNRFQKILNYDLGDRKVPEKFSERFEKGRRMGVFKDEALRRGYIPYLLSNFYYKNYLFVVVDDNHKSCYVVDTKNPKNVFRQGPITEYFDLPNIKSLHNPVDINESYITFACEPLDFYEMDEINQTKHVYIGKDSVVLDYDSNPFLIIVE